MFGLSSWRRVRHAAICGGGDGWVLGGSGRRVPPRSRGVVSFAATNNPERIQDSSSSLSASSLGRRSGNQPYKAKSTVRSPSEPRSTVTPSAASAASCRAAPFVPLREQALVPLYTMQTFQDGIPDTDHAFRVNDTLPRYGVAVVPGIGLVAGVGEILQADAHLAVE